MIWNVNENVWSTMMKKQTLTKNNITLKTSEKDRERMLSYSMERQLHLLGMVLSCISECYRFQAFVLWYHLIWCNWISISGVRMLERTPDPIFGLMKMTLERTICWWFLVQKFRSKYMNCRVKNVANYKIIKKRKDVCFKYNSHIFLDSVNLIDLKNILQ